MSAEPLPDPRITPYRADLAADTLHGSIQAAAYAPGQPMTVVAPVLDLLPRPDPASALGSQLLAGEGFTVYEVSEGFAWGQSLTDGYVGYVPADGLAQGAAMPTHQITARTAQVYDRPTLKSRPVRTLPFLARLQVDELLDGYVRSGDGYIPAPQIGPIEALSDDPVEIAERFAGVPYLWGGRSILGLDCSALVQLAWQAAGRSLPRDSDMLEKLGEAVDGELERGDLVFWRGHVGVMQDKTQMLHANAHHMAVESEPLETAIARIAATDTGKVTSIRRL